MTVEELKVIAADLDIPNWQFIRTEPQLIWAIQKARGEECCFLTDKRVHCWTATCEWHSSCLKLVAEWRR